uniref:Bradykinin receptor B1 n=1 Tax=Sphaeramia orbicularis TaxID=375764 RepID=A0A673C986_9TELE
FTTSLKYTSVTALWDDNNSTSLPSEPPLSAEWDIIYTVVPPYIFTVSILGLLFNSFVLVVLPFWAMNILNDFNWPYGDALCKIINSAIIVNFYTSVYTLVMISVDRYLALVKTMKARWLRRTLYAKVICFILWITGAFIEELQTVSCILDYSHESSWKLAHQILMNTAGFVFPVLVIVFSSVSIITVLAKRRESVGFRECSGHKGNGFSVYCHFPFLLCWGPFQSVWFHTLDIGGQVSVYLAFLNSALNPLLYVFSGQYFRRKVSAIYRQKRHLRRGSDMTTYQRSVISTYINRTEQIKPVVIFTAKPNL